MASRAVVSVTDSFHDENFAVPGVTVYRPMFQRNAGLPGQALQLLWRRLTHVRPAFQQTHLAAVAEANGPDSGLAILNAIEPEAVSSYQPYCAVHRPIVWER